MHRIAQYRTPSPGTLVTPLLALLLAVASAPATLAEAADGLGAPTAAAPEISPNLTDDERAHVVELLESSRSEMEALAAKARGDVWLTQPGEGSWSVGEVVEHLVLSEEMFHDLVIGALAAEPNPDWQAVAQAGTAGIETNLKDRSRKFNAPEMLQPAAEASRDDMLARYAAARAKLLDFVRSVDGPVKQHTYTGPPGTMNVHQWLVLVGAHNLRHNQQMKEALEAVR